jgi:hypothetical protein
MEGTLVSARVSKAKKDACTSVLESLGASTTELINCAFDYVLENKALPSVADGRPQSTKDSISGFQDFVGCSTMAIDWSCAPTDYKEIIRAGKAADYESIA